MNRSKMIISFIVLACTVILITNAGASKNNLEESSTTKKSAVQIPIISSEFVWCPKFKTKQGTLSAGKAFLASHNNQILVITAQHIFGPAGGLRQDVPNNQMSSFTKEVSLEDIVSGKTKRAKLTCIPMPADLDVAVFKTTMDYKNKPPPFSTKDPEIGEAIWLASTVIGQPKKNILHRGIVVAGRSDEIRCKYDEGNIETRGVSGAPYINANGEIVGLHSGSYKNPGKKMASIIPASVIKANIQ